MMNLHDRRGSPRVPCALEVRYPGLGDRFEVTEGSISLGGVDFIASRSAPESSLVVEVRLPVGASSIHTTAVPLSERPEEEGRRISASFIGLDIRTELALARWLDEQTPGHC